MLSNLRIYKFVITLLLMAIILSPYISSWLPILPGIPSGSAVRSLMFLCLFAITVKPVISMKFSRSQAWLINIMLVYVFFVLMSFVGFWGGVATASQFVIGIHSFAVYPALYLILHILFHNENIGVKYSFIQYSNSLLVWIFLIISTVAIIDVITSGELVAILGYNPSYGGDGFSLITRYYSIVRANGGFSDALVFGYLMALGVIFFINEIEQSRDERRPIMFIGVLMCVIAGMLSITRGAMLVIALVSMLYLIKSRYKFLVIFTTLVLFCVVFFSDYYSVLLGRFTDSDPASRASTSLRWTMALNSVEFMSENPLGLGVGTQGAGNILSLADQRINSDNFIFHIFIELGFISGIIFLIFWFSQVFSVFRESQSLKLSFSLLALFLISAIFSSSFQSATLSTFFWFVAYVSTQKSRFLMLSMKVKE